MAAVNLKDLLEAFDFVGSAPPTEHQAYISLDTGEILWVSEFVEDEDVPDDVETSDRYIEVPHKNDLDLGRHLALRFAERALPDQYATVERIFQRRGTSSRGEASSVRGEWQFLPISTWASIAVTARFDDRRTLKSQQTGEHGYEGSPLEAIAFELQARFEFGTCGLSIAEHVTRHALQARDAAALVFRANGLEMGV